MNISNLENKIEYKFTKIKYLEQALTHSSFNNQSNSYERLEFLGDRILGFIVAEEIFRNMPHIREGQMHLMCEFLINEDNSVNFSFLKQIIMGLFDNEEYLLRHYQKMIVCCT